MIIGVDAGCLSIRDRRLKVGVYRLSFNLLNNLSQIDKTNRYLLYSFSPISQEILSYFGTNMENKVLRPRRFWLTVRVSLEFLLKKPDIFLGLSQSLPLFHPLKSIVFIYDLAFEYHPDCYPGSFNRLSRQTRYAVRHSDRIVTTSHSTKADLVKLYGIDEKGIEIIYPGVDSIFSPQPPKKVDRIKEKYRLEKPYFLFVGSLKPIKNIPRIIDGFYKFLRQIKKSYQLVIVGSNFWLDKKITKRIKQLKMEKEIVNLGYLPVQELPGIYTGAFVFVSPSLYEGFGLPLLEAMACGTPIITSNVGSMPEVVGDAAFLVNPENIDEISNALIEITKSSSLRDALRRKGLKRVKKFTWNRFATNVLSLIHNLK